MQKASQSLGNLRTVMLSRSVVIAGRSSCGGIHVGCGSGCCRRRSCRIHMVVMVVVITVSPDAGQRVGCWSGLCSQVMVVGRDRVFVGMVVKGLRCRGLQPQFVVWRAGPASCGTGEWNQATSTGHRKCRAEHPGHELLVSGIGMQGCPAGCFPFILPPTLSCICNRCQRKKEGKGTRISNWQRP